MDTRRRRALIESFEPRIMYSAGPGPAGLAAAVLTAAEVQVDGGEALQGSGSELVFIDARVPELQRLLDDLAAQQQGGRAIEVVVIGADEDGIAVVGDSLAGRTDVTAIHLIGHGTDGVADQLVEREVGRGGERNQVVAGNDAEGFVAAEFAKEEAGLGQRALETEGAGGEHGVCQKEG